MTIKEMVIATMKKHPSTRANDNKLIRYILKDYYQITTLDEVVENFDVNIYENIRRARQKAQETNPMLKPDDKTVTNRARREKKVRRLVKGV